MGHGHLEVDKVLNIPQAPHHEGADSLQEGVDTGLMVVALDIRHVAVEVGIRCAVAGDHVHATADHSNLHQGVELMDSEE